MARAINKATILGNLGSDPELRYTKSGTAVANMSVATNESYKDSDGELVEKTTWHRVTAWGRLAEICAEYLKKGSQVYFEGRMTHGEYENEDGQTVRTFEITAREMVMLGSPEGGSARKSGYASEQNGQKAAPVADDDSLPF